MAKDRKDRIKEMAGPVEKRYGNTTGASKGKKPAPSGKVKLKPGKTTRITYEKKF